MFTLCCQEGSASRLAVGAPGLLRSTTYLFISVVTLLVKALTPLVEG